VKRKLGAPASKLFSASLRTSTKSLPPSTDYSKTAKRESDKAPEDLSVNLAESPSPFGRGLDCCDLLSKSGC